MAPKFIMLCNKNEFKTLSLEDNLYFTLRDIFVNVESIYDFMTANKFSGELTNGIYFENRTPEFRYSNVLHDKEYVYNLLAWLSHMDDSCFKDVEEVDRDLYEIMEFGEWFSQFTELKNLLNEHYEQICMKSEDI